MILNESVLQAQKAISPVARQAATEGMVLLKNDQSVLPLERHETVSVFGRCQINTYRSGTGSGGAVNVPYAVNAIEGLRANPHINLNENLAAVYADWVRQNPFDDGGGGWAAEPWFQQEMPLTSSLIDDAAKQSDKAVIIIGRTAGEDQDNADASGSYRLTELEQQMIEQVSAAFKQVVLVLNVTNIMDMSWLNTLEHAASIQAILYAWTGGMEGGNALADILSGDQSPSGKLTDTIAKQLSDYPSHAHFGRKDFNLYVEDIYVGYRYFETFAPEAVLYEFGAGLSYTEFHQELKHFRIEGDDAQCVLVYEVTVTNTGAKYSGKQVVQLYVEAPQGRLGKPARALVGFAKTDTLAPGESGQVTITLPVTRLASYDDSGVTGARNCSVLEAGHYCFYLGGSVRQAVKTSAEFQLKDLLVIEKHREAAAPVQAFDRLVPGEKNEDGRFSKTYQPVPLRTISLADRIAENKPETLEISGDVGIKLIDVKEGRASLEQFVAQMSVEQLATIVRGEGMCSPKVTPGTAAAFGGVSTGLFDLGIPVAAAADGPSGIRMDSGHKATQVPIGTQLGCTWNVPLNEQLYRLVGEELVANEIDTLLGPGINIHRHPLNGRNFEYFSECPFITGTMAAAQTRGLAKAGVSGTMKHYAANDQETARVDVDSVVSERALREIHLKPFEMAVKEGEGSSIMTAYNPVNGHWTASHYDLNTTILRGEWGYTGIVMTDWWAKMNDPISAGKESKQFTSFMVRSQNDLYMVVENEGAERNAMADDTLSALENGSLTIGELQRSAMNICRFIVNAPVMNRPLNAYEPVKTFTANERVRDAAKPIEKSLELNTKTDVELFLEVTNSGVYDCIAQVSYDRNSLAQSTCSIALNGEFAFTVFGHGTDGKTVDVEGAHLKLEPGVYRLSVHFVKPGMKLERLDFTEKSK